MNNQPPSTSTDDFCTVTLHLELEVIEKLKKKAEKQGISYKDLIRSVIHDHVNTDNSIMDMIGANKGSGLYESAEEVDETITQLRNEWD